MNLPVINDACGIAMLLDFDGTLVEIAATPDSIRFEEDSRASLIRLREMTGGAVAIVTGREIAVVDRYLAPLLLPVAGVHGLERRDAEGHLHQGIAPEAFLSDAERTLRELTSTHRGLAAERKSHSIALHYRGNPTCAALCISSLQNIAEKYRDIEILHGQMVVEARPAGTNKGTAVTEFMREAPFHGRRPLFAGDDVTDEDAFRVVNDMGGISVKIGAGATSARYRMANTRAFLDWLARTARTLEGERPRNDNQQ